jgi:hypothetical protein
VTFLSPLCGKRLDASALKTGTRPDTTARPPVILPLGRGRDGVADTPSPRGLEFKASTSAVMPPIAAVLAALLSARRFLC